MEPFSQSRLRAVEIPILLHRDPGETGQFNQNNHNVHASKHPNHPEPFSDGVDCFGLLLRRPQAAAASSKGGGDPALTISKCQNASYLAALTFAGVKAGNECWCSPFVAGEHARNQSDCNLPCSGDKNEVWGGKEFINVFEPIKADQDEPVHKPTTTSTTSSSTSTSTPGTSGDNRNRVNGKPAKLWGDEELPQFYVYITTDFGRLDITSAALYMWTAGEAVLEVTQVI